MHTRSISQRRTNPVAVALCFALSLLASLSAQGATGQEVCDVNGSGSVTSSDAPILLKAAAGDPMALALCGGTVTTTTTLATSPYTLSIAKQDDGMGTVTSKPVGINCGGDCSEEYEGSIQVTLTAAAGTGSEFTGWSGAVPSGCSGSTAPCTVTMARNRSVTATFIKDAAVTCPTNGPLTDLRLDCTDYG